MNITECLSKDNVHLDFSITDPIRSFAGHTVYRVVLKFRTEDGTSVGSGEVTLWRRYSEFRRLHRDLKVLFEKQNHSDHFPDFVGPKLFGRFDDQVIEERRKSASTLLAFIVKRKQLRGSDLFKKFVQTAVNNNVANKRTSEENAEDDADEMVQRGGSTSSTSSNLNDESGSPAQTISCDGTWSHRQPTPEPFDDRPCVEGGQDNESPQVTSEDRSSYEQYKDTVSLDNSGTTDIDISQDEGEVNGKVAVEAEEIGVEAAEDNNDDVFGGDEDTVVGQREWLRHAFSICSEGGDIERLASEAEDDYPMPSPNVSPRTKNRSGIFSFRDDSSRDSSDNADESVLSRPPLDEDKDFPLPFSEETKPASTSEQQEIIGECDNTLIPGKDMLIPEAPDLMLEMSRRDSFSRASASVIEISETSNRTAVGESSQNEDLNEGTAVSSTASSITCADFTIGKAMSEVIEEVVGEDDYIYQASLAMSEAIEYEAVGDYGAAFQLYKFGVGVLLHGVQQDENSSRREAVRRKTAQYLLKAETLYQTYLAKVNQTSNSASRTPTKVAQPTQLKASLSLKDLQVIGTVDKLMLVENLRTGEEFVMKVLHKCSAEYKRSRSTSNPQVPPLLYNCKNVVKLISYIETWTGIYLLLEHIPSGRLWDFLGLKYNNSQRIRMNGRLTSSEKLSETSLKKRCSFLRQNSRLPRDDFDNDISEPNRSAFDVLNVSPMHQEGSLTGLQCRPSFGKSVKSNNGDTEWISEGQVQHLAAQLVVCLEDLHAHGIICKDLNPRNILIDENEHIKLTFFSAVTDVDYILDEEAVDNQYAAPEVDGVFEVTKAADWWSFGAILFELLTAKSLISCHPGGIHSHSIITLPRPVSRCALSLLSELLRYNHKDRLGSGPTGAEEIKAHPFFVGINWDELSK